MRRIRRLRTRLTIWLKLTYVKIQGRFLRARRLAYRFAWKRIVAPLYWHMSRDIDILIANREASVEEFSIAETVTEFSEDRDYWYER